MRYSKPQLYGTNVSRGWCKSGSFAAAEAGAVACRSTGSDANFWCHTGTNGPTAAECVTGGNAEQWCQYGTAAASAASCGDGNGVTHARCSPGGTP